MALGTYGVGVYGADSYAEATTVPALALLVREKPPLRVSVEVENPAGKQYRWAEDEPSPVNVPSGLRWSDTMPGGFESMDCTLPRKASIDYSDLEQLSTIRVRGASGDIAGEYRLERAPRTSGDQMSISPGAVGWQAHLEDNKSATEVWVDQDLSRWASMAIGRRVDHIAAGHRVFDGAVQPDQTMGFPTVLLTIGEAAVFAASEMLYDAGVASRIATIYYDFVAGTNLSPGAPTELVHIRFHEVDDQVSGAVSDTGNLDAATQSGYFTPGVNYRYVSLQFYLTGGASAVEYDLYWRKLTLYGDHGLTLRGEDPGGLYASDIVVSAVGRWAPLLTTTTESVQQSGFVIPHLAFYEPTTAGEMIRQATRFGLQDWAVWENKTFWWHERGAFAKRWRSRVSPAQLDETGPQVDRLWESITVSYQDVDGSTRTVGPPGSGADVIDASLKDNDPDNPANQLGIIRRDVLQMGTSTSAGAIEVGRRFLEESQLLDRSGRARVVGHVEDDHGVVHPYWRPRAGDYISFTDAADTSPRRIVKTDKDHASRTCGLDLDAPPEGLKALLERLGVVLVPLGLS